MSDQLSYPLKWPQGWPRTKPENRRQAQFRKPGYYSTDPRQDKKWIQQRSHTVSEALAFIESELTKLGAKSIVCSSNLSLKNDGRPRSNQGRPNDVGIAIYFSLNQNPHVIACDRWNRCEDNLWAIGKTIEADRGKQRWGAVTTEQAFTGYIALQEKTQETWREVLGIEKEHPTEDEINAAYHVKLRTAHPDLGGNVEAFQKVRDALHNANAWLKSNVRISDRERSAS